MSAFRAAKYAWLTTEAYRRIPWTPQLQAYFNSHFVPLTEGPDCSTSGLCPADPAVLVQVLQ
jgi:hypothetical protein